MSDTVLNRSYIGQGSEESQNTSMHILAKNASGSTIWQGQLVYAVYVGPAGYYVNVLPTDVSADPNVMPMGVVASGSIASGSSGRICVKGIALVRCGAGNSVQVGRVVCPGSAGGGAGGAQYNGSPTVNAMGVWLETGAGAGSASAGTASLFYALIR